MNSDDAGPAPTAGAAGNAAAVVIREARADVKATDDAASRLRDLADLLNSEDDASSTLSASWPSCDNDIWGAQREKENKENNAKKKTKKKQKKKQKKKERGHIDASMVNEGAKNRPCDDPLKCLHVTEDELLAMIE